MKIHPVLPLVLSLVTIGLPGLRCFVWVCFGTFEQHVKVPDSIFMVILSMLKILSLLTELFKIIEACHRFTLSHLSLSTWVDLRYISNKEISKLLLSQNKWVYTKSKLKKKSPPPKIYRIFPFYQLTCKPLLCSPNQKIIIETQFNPVASHHLNLLEKKYAKKYPQKKLCKKYHQIIKKILFLEVYLSTTFQVNQKPNFELEALKIQHFL